jgi:stearoyl-CoA desaturase (delta-9 desaturase)
MTTANLHSSLPFDQQRYANSHGWQGPQWLAWLDSDHFPQGKQFVREQAPQIEFLRMVPFTFLHLGALAAIWVPFSWQCLALLLVLYVVRMFAITAFYHRYFAHKAFKTHRWFQAVMAFVGGTSLQRGALWWAANHRHHHAFSDKPNDLHSVRHGGFMYAHIGWLTSSHSMPTDYRLIKDFERFPELLWLNRFDWVPPVFLFFAMIALGALTPWFTVLQALIWGFFLGSVVLFHGTVFINSLAHVWGNRRYDTTDDSKNNFWLSLITLGEGWHNNHHRFPGTVKQGFFWWEIDVSYYILKAMSWVGLVWDLRPVPKQAYELASK